MNNKNLPYSREKEAVGLLSIFLRSTPSIKRRS